MTAGVGVVLGGSLFAGAQAETELLNVDNLSADNTEAVYDSEAELLGLSNAAAGAGSLENVPAISSISNLDQEETSPAYVPFLDVETDLLHLQSTTTHDRTDLVAPVELSQVTGVSELDDVLPTDWAYTALTRLVEEYGCLEGYPDSTFRGNRAMTRYEFAAGLNACLDVIIALTGSPEDSDLGTIQRLQEDFAAELASIRSQLDALEADVATLEDTQFSTTTKLSGRLFTHLTGVTASGDIQAEGISVFAPARDATGAPVVRTITDDPEVTFSYLTWLNLLTSFTGKDRLILQLAVGDGVAPANTFASAGLFNTFGTPFTAQQGGQLEDDVILREAFYSFPLGDKVLVTVGPKINWYRHFDDNKYTFLVTGANSFNSSGGTQVNAVDRGAGVVVEWDVFDALELSVGYLAEATEFIRNSASSDATRGLFNGANTLTAQAEVYPTDNLTLRFLYTLSELEANANGFVGGAVSEPLYGFADDGFGGPLDGATADTFMFNFDWQPLNWLGFFGRYSYGSTDLSVITPGRPDGEVNAQSLQLGLAFHDLLKSGSLATISYLRPFDVTDGRNFLISGGGDGAVQEEIEVSYRYPVTPNFAVVPSVYWIGNANNFGDNPDIYVFNLQTQFSF
ncbi:iron uptake porin [Leptothoe sp. PORK10 BA2]|uniref:iron uptake porin n=1 Tax=Leptothoe sp. PORK10 BA2 TaxID=3110254 RepID=UPI002B21691D|nr:iron uptake porin [Leptothoe sp. PORK10 BA2]MEA5462599.1 iron uptake porin [Leptothoe sp. PORK10 BA2]